MITSYKMGSIKCIGKEMNGSIDGTEYLLTCNRIVKKIDWKNYTKIRKETSSKLIYENKNHKCCCLKRYHIS